MALVIAALLVTIALLLLPRLLRVLHAVIQNVRIHFLLRSVPGPPSYPLIGTLPTLLRGLDDMHGELLHLQRTYGSTIRLSVLGRATLLVMDPDDVQVVCTHPALANKPETYGMMQDHLGWGLLNMNGPNYKRHRKAITPSLHLGILQDFVPTFAKNAMAMADRLQAHADSGDAFDITPEFGITANMTVTETVLSSQVTDSRGELANMTNVLKETSEQVMWRGMRPWWSNDVVFMLSSRHKAFKQTAAALNATVQRILQRKSREVSEGVPPPPRRRMAFLDHVLRSAESANMSPEELADELKTFLFAGSTTSMDFMSFVVLVFAMYPDVQSKVHKELDEIFGEDRERAVTSEDLPHMQYLERVLKETLRYAPPAPFFFRKATEDLRLPCGHLVPRGCGVMLAPAGTHRDPRYYPDPLTFDPDRFLAENSSGRHPFAYIPFSAGSRNCVGQRYALMFTKTLAATLLRRFSFERAAGGPRDFADVHVVPGITMSVRGGAIVRVRRRDAWHVSARTARTSTQD